MQFHLGAIPPTQEFTQDPAWKPLGEPGPVVMQCLALPIGAVAATFIALGWLYLTPLTKNPTASPLWMSIGLILLFPVHELLHTALHPHQGKSSNSIIGFWPSRMLFYAHYLGDLSRTRFITILTMPFVVISVLPLLVCTIVGHASVTLAFVSGLNALAAGGDLFAIGLLLFQVPSTATVRNQAWRTYWSQRPVNSPATPKLCPP